MVNRGPRGKLIATPSVCSYRWPLNRKSRSFVTALTPLSSWMRSTNWRSTTEVVWSPMMFLPYSRMYNLLRYNLHWNVNTWITLGTQRCKRDYCCFYAQSALEGKQSTIRTLSEAVDELSWKFRISKTFYWIAKFRRSLPWVFFYHLFYSFLSWLFCFKWRKWQFFPWTWIFKRGLASRKFCII